ncbi:MAG: DUF1501 domain-containing protein [Chitinophagaceae bacterium]|nr:DUF1501 domain-containing protein [Chitinophagaceae bacterium]
MKRRDFLKITAPAVTLPSILGGYSVKALGENSSLARLMGMGTETDHVLVIVQLQGGNDGLNMIVPLDQYSKYFNARNNIAIPEAKVLRLNGYTKAGLHPAMTGMQSLYNEGKLNIVQAVGYPKPNFSHFRATDIWMSASESTEYVNTGWTGRYLNNQYPDFPNGYPNATMPDPLGIQIGSLTSLNFQGPQISMGMSISNPNTFYNLVNGVQDPAPPTPAGKELTYVRLIAQQTQQYATVIKDAAARVTSQLTYPTPNSLADQLKIVARLIGGGLRTRVYMVSYGSFDTHATQVNTTDTVTGTHANLLKNVSDAIKAFQDDLKALGVEEKVMGVTFSEFGRRIKSNGSSGTDHGAAAPLFVFGKNAIGGVTGETPVLPTTATVNDNVAFQYDFRSIYASILENWFCADNTDLQTVLLRNFQSLPLVNGANCKAPIVPESTVGNSVLKNYPNPFAINTTIEFKTNGGHTLIQILDTSGRVIAVPLEKVYPAPAFDKIVFNGERLSLGTYYIRLQNGSVSHVKVMLKVNY